jgi:hypothetical protein
MGNSQELGRFPNKGSGWIRIRRARIQK